MPRRIRVPSAVAVVYAVALACVALWPTPVDSGVNVANFRLVRFMDRHLGLDPDHGYDVVQFAANVVLFVPLGVLASLLLPRWRWWAIILLGVTASCCIELAQDLFRPERFATVGDVVSNSIGGLIGALVVVVQRRTVRPARLSKVCD